MRILYASERPPYPFFLGGAARSAHNLMSILSKDFSVQCLAIGSKDFTNNPPWSCPKTEDFISLGISSVSPDQSTILFPSNYTVQVYDNFPPSLAKVIDEFSPDFIWTQLDGIEEVTQIAHEKGIKVILYLRDAEDSPVVIKKLASLGICIICNSHFMASRVKKITGKTAQVIYPSLENTFGVSGDSQGCITMINPSKVKGIDTFLEIARQLPEESFILVESWSLSDSNLAALQDKLSNLTNVKFSRRVPDIQSIYRQTKLLIVPSVWEEAFGRVVIEAQSCGIPVIASTRGGLPESVGSGGVCVDNYLNIDAWLTAIKQITLDEKNYRFLVKKAQEHAADKQFSTQYAATQFLDICGEPLNFQKSFKNKLSAILNRWI